MKRILYIILIFLVFGFSGTMIATINSYTDGSLNEFLFAGRVESESNSFTIASATRGEANDLWADKIVGKRDFGEISPRKVVPDKLSAPGGVIVDRSVTPGRMYVWDSGNNRVLGVDLATCYATDEGAGQRCSGTIAIGQPSTTDYGACNQDSSFSDYPNRSPASASTICGIPEWTHTVLEDKSFSNMFVDGSGNLWVPDVYNNRVLKFISPFTTDLIADEVWGQTDFAGNLCNQSGGYFGLPGGSPTASTLCSPGGVSLDTLGNLWITDSGNSRVLRYPNVSGTISKTADRVIGQANFTSNGGGSGLNQLGGPSTLVFDSSGRLYISDGNNRVMKYVGAFTNGMSGTVYLDNTKFNGNIVSIQIDPSGNFIWTYEVNGFTGYFDKFNLSGTSQLAAKFTNWNPGGGSIGIDTQGNILISAYVYGQDVIRYSYNSGSNIYEVTKNLFWPPSGGYNLSSADRFEEGSWAGMVVTNNQLFVTDSRLMFWNNPTSVTNGQAPDGYVGGGALAFPGFVVMAKDQDGRIYVQKNSSIEIYQTPVTGASTPVATIAWPLNVLGGGTTTIQDTVGGITASAHGEFLWITDVSNNRVLRIRNPRTAPLVDVVIGQTNITGNQCNRGIVAQPNVDGGSHAALDMLCNSGELGTDIYGNLYISDHFFESAGNWRMLMFAASTFPASPSSVIFAPMATKEFPRYGIAGSTHSHATFKPAFNSKNTMVVGYNPYLGPRFLEYYNTPQAYNVSNPSDPSYANPAGQINDFYAWAFTMDFDSSDNLYVYDTNRGKVQIYMQPFDTVSPTIAEVTVVTTPTVDTTPNYKFTSNEGGTINYTGDCTSPTAVAVSGDNNITFNTLGLGTHSNCTITVTDNSSNISNTITVTSFTITSPVVLTEVSPVTSPTADSTPNYTFNSSRDGLITYGGSCSSSTGSAIAGDNTITFNTLGSATYSNCTIKVTDINSIESNVLNVTPFTISLLKSFGDFNSDHIVDLSDLSILATYWQTHNTAADCNNDGVVDLSDLSILAQNWQRNV